MKYTHRQGVVLKSHRRRWLVLPVLGALGGLYILVNILAPALPAGLIEGDAVAQRLTTQQPAANDNRLYIPQIGVDVALNSEADALEAGAIHRAPASGNPEDGGNFVVVAQRFQLGWTPQQTRANSPFYHLDKLQVGNQFYIDYNGKRYAYEVREFKSFDANSLEIEAPSQEDRLTLYAHELTGSEGDRQAIIAEPIGTIAWVDGRPKLKTL